MDKKKNRKIPAIDLPSAGVFPMLDSSKTFLGEISPVTNTGILGPKEEEINPKRVDFGH